MGKEFIDNNDIIKFKATNKINKIYNELNDVEKDTLYRKLRLDYVKEDIYSLLYSLLEDENLPLDEESMLAEKIANIVSERYVYDGDYDCNLTYWDNLRNLINEVQKELDEPEMEL